MKVLTLNCGSSSIKAEVVDTGRPEPLARLAITRLADEGTDAHVELAGSSRTEPLDEHAEALEATLPELLEEAGGREGVEAVAHRVVHGGDEFADPVRIDDDVLETIESLAELAPLHNPVNAAGIRAARGVLDAIPHVAIFDTAFHQTIPESARQYAIPPDVAEEHDIRRFGFHGISHGYVAGLAADHLGAEVDDVDLITCHLGNGCSVAAVQGGESVETSMGMTPLEGLVMGTRSGDIDPGAVLELLRSGRSVDDVDALLNRESGLAGLSGLGPDLRDIEAAADDGDVDAERAIEVFAHRAQKYVGAYAAVMGGVDAVVFTAGIGQHSAPIRRRISGDLEFLGASIDRAENESVELSREEPVARVSTADSDCALLAVRTDESRAMAETAAGLI